MSAPDPRLLREYQTRIIAPSVSDHHVVLPRQRAIPYAPIIPRLAIEMAPQPHFGIVAAAPRQSSTFKPPSSSLLISSCWNRDYSSPSQSIPRFLPAIFSNDDSKVTSDLLQAWKDDINSRSSLASSSVPTTPAASISGVAFPRAHIKRYSSAPTTPSLHENVSRLEKSSVRSSHLFLSESGLGLGVTNAGEFRMSSHNMQSQSDVSSCLSTSTETAFPSTSLQTGFTHRLPGEGNG
jgi:hypothetical protein